MEVTKPPLLMELVDRCVDLNKEYKMQHIRAENSEKVFST